MRQYYPVLSIAGSDSSGGAGIQADIKTISAIGCYAMTAITAVTAQNTTGVAQVQGISPSVVMSQLEMVCADIPPMAVKTGMLYDSAIVEVVSSCMESMNIKNLVVDPVMVSTSGSVLLEEDAVETIKNRIFPQALVVTPNLAEARYLTGFTDPAEAAASLHAMGCTNVIVKGGDARTGSYKTDFVSLDCGAQQFELKADAIDTRNTHGTGCTFSAAIASYLAQGISLTDSIKAAKLYVTRAIEAGAFITCGHGRGPVNHFFSPRKLKNYNPR